MSALAVRQVSLATKIKQVTGLSGTTRVDSQTNAFLEGVESQTGDGRDTSMLTDGQVEWINRIWREYFA